MQVIHSPDDIFSITLNQKINHRKIGLVPTMGALHQGHLSLVERAAAENDIVVVSIFVNPLQFNNPSDLQNYPRNLAMDTGLLSSFGVHFIYAPGEEAMYPFRPVIKFDYGPLASVMEGKFRPDHFEGVGLVVTKLFHQCNPDRAYFGLKDLQQYLLVRRLVMDLSFAVEVVGMPTIRETSGLAMSSRNQRLSQNGSRIAANLYRGLRMMEDLWKQGKGPDETKSTGIEFYEEIPGLSIEYLEIVDPETLSNVLGNQFQAVALCVAGYVEGIRLIDNLYLRQD